MRPALLLLLPSLWLMAPAHPQPSIPEQLHQALDDQNWDQAIAILDQLIEAEDQDKADLQEYRQFLIQQQGAASPQPMETPEVLIYNLSRPVQPTTDPAEATLMALCMSELTTLSQVEAQPFCQCTVDQIAQRYDLTQVAANPDQALISPEDSAVIYQFCSTRGPSLP